MRRIGRSLRAMCCMGRCWATTPGIWRDCGLKANGRPRDLRRRRATRWRLDSVRRLYRRWSDQSLFLQPAERQTIAAVDAGLFEDMLEVDFYSAWTNAELYRNIFVFHSLFDQVE